VKKALRALAWLVGTLVLVVAAFALYVQVAGIPHYPVQLIGLTVEPTPERVVRGKKLASLLCAGCHRDPVTGWLTGKRMVDAPAEFGVVYSRNITQHKTKGIGAWTDGEIAFLLRTGIRRNGQYAPPYMVKLPFASDEDIASIIAFLRSDDAWVAAADVDTPETQPSFLTKLLTRTVFGPFPYPRDPIPEPDRTNAVAYGKYLSTTITCFACHSADFKTNDDLHPERSKGYMGGGNVMLDAAGRPIETANITMDAETGIGKWTEAQFIRAVKGGFRPDNTPLLYPMDFYAELTDDEVRAIFAYLKTVPPLSHARTLRRVTGAERAATASGGEAVYRKYRCDSCHGDAGVANCDLRQGPRKYPTDADLAAFIKNPALAVPGSKMPAWEGVIDEAEYPTLVAYVRTLGERSRATP
jgi:mono/diheme cytochrome c family protein